MRTITLIGMMGAGKTTVSKILGEKLNIPSIDMDMAIEISQGKTAVQIFNDFGEDFFRKTEESLLINIFRDENMIISTGGGMFENSRIRNLLLKNSVVIYLKTSPRIIFERVKTSTQRPLLNNNMSIENIKRILDNRTVNYEKAHYMITTDNKTPLEIAQEILGVL